MTKNDEMKFSNGGQPGARPHTYLRVENDRVVSTPGGVIEEFFLNLYVNGQELATVMCSPIDLEALALGFLYNEGIIDSLDEVGLIKPNTSGATIDIFLTRSTFEPPRKLIITSGCGGGVTLQQLTETRPPLETEFSTEPQIIAARMQDLHSYSHLYRLVRGVHTAVMAATDNVLVAAEDVGRHNAVDKVAGKALRNNISTADCILLTSGRISSEMLGKARRMRIPIVVSRTAPTSISIQLAEAWNICVVGYVRRNTMRVYTHPQRLGLGPIID